MHSWAKVSDLPKPMVILNPAYIRRGGIVQLQVKMTNDKDTCTVHLPPCSFPGNTAPNRVVVEEWHADAGGAFGRLDEHGNFVPEGDHTKVTHYKPPEDYTGHVSITVKINDIPRAIDPATGQEIATWNDEPPAVSDPAKLTVWEFEIDPPYIDALPQDGATYTFTATIRPATDHLGNSMARIIEFRLVSSSEPGYCLNATRIEGQWTDTSPEDNDLKFVPNQPELEVDAEGPNPTNFSRAITKKPVLTASVQVRCLDYGAYGSVGAIAYGLGPGPTPARRRGTLVTGAEIPLDQRDGLDNDGDGDIDEDLRDGLDNDKDGRVDEDGISNYIYDGWQWNNGAATDDDDPQPPNQLPPANQPRPGDGLSRYEEYRGFVIQRSHERLNPNVKNVFIYNPHGLDISGFATLGLQIHIVWRGEFEAVFDRPRDTDGDGRIDEDPLNGRDDDGDRWFDEDPADEDYPIPEQSTFAINRFWRTANVVIQRAIPLLYHPAYDPRLPNERVGEHGAGLPGWYPYALVYIRQMRHYTNPNPGDWSNDPRDPFVIRLIVSHELGNSVNILDHSGATTRNCVMYDTGNSQQNVNFDPVPQEYCANRGDIPQGCRLLFYLR